MELLKKMGGGGGGGEETFTEMLAAKLGRSSFHRNPGQHACF